MIDLVNFGGQKDRLHAENGGLRNGTQQEQHRLWTYNHAKLAIFYTHDFQPLYKQIRSHYHLNQQQLVKLPRCLLIWSNAPFRQRWRHTGPLFTSDEMRVLTKLLDNRNLWVSLSTTRVSCVATITCCYRTCGFLSESICWALMLFLLAWTSCWTNSRVAGKLRRRITFVMSGSLMHLLYINSEHQSVYPLACSPLGHVSI